MTKVFIAQKMTGLTEGEVMKNREVCREYFKEYLSEEYPDVEFIDNYTPEAAPKEAVETTHERLWYLGHSLQLLSTADLVIFATDAPDAKGCVVERMICEMYGIPFIEMEIHMFNPMIRTACWNLAHHFKNQEI
ncbi:MAG: ThiF family adenylyltransferase [Lachnospiraceae bacterium]|nr:ThiF family adenylyltransferase [Lachnospiraceae bacterium]